MDELKSPIFTVISPSYCPISFDISLMKQKEISFFVPGNPFAKQRPRARKIGRFISVYTPNETKKYEEKVRIEYNKWYRDSKLENDLTVDIEGIFSIPKSTPKKYISDMVSGIIPHTSKPDCDNMAKICLDALNGVCYDDDSQITNLNISKKYGNNARVVITIRENNSNGGNI